MANKLEIKYNAKIILITDECNKFANNYITSIHNYDYITKLIKFSNKKIIIIIHSFGGNVYDSDIIINTILRYKYNIECYIPEYAFSAASLIALATNKIYMNKYGCLGPTDPQLSFIKGNEKITYSAKTLLEYLKISKKLKNCDNDYIINALHIKPSYKDNFRTITKILKLRNIPKYTRKQIYNIFCSGNHPHDMPIYYDDLKKLELHVELGIPKEINKIFNYFILFSYYFTN